MKRFFAPAVSSSSGSAARPSSTAAPSSSGSAAEPAAPSLRVLAQLESTVSSASSANFQAWRDRNQTYRRKFDIDIRFWILGISPQW